MQTTSHHCPACNHHEMTVFYSVKNVPVHSCLLTPSAEQARKFARRDIALGFCEACGFISNVIFDPAVHDYSPGYEDQQSFSGTFNTFAKKLARRYIERYGLRDKTIVEIGCSKGDFLLLLCELGSNTGIGIDPSCVPGRVESASSDRVTFVQDFYSEEHAVYEADFICCRHTLEHIGPTADFVSTVRRSIRAGQDPVVSFELPDVSRILKELAFWDIYYEHCSYFSAGSLARLFRRCDFELVDLQREYGDQYLVIDAKAANKANARHFELEDDLLQLREDVRHFAANHHFKLEAWRDFIINSKKSDRRLAIWGSGSKCVAFLTTLGLEDAVETIVDINPHRHGKYIPGVGLQIRSPEYLKEFRPHDVIVMNPIYEAEIQSMMAEMGVKATTRPV